MAGIMGILPINIRLSASLPEGELSEIATGTIDLEIVGKVPETAHGVIEQAKVLIEAPEMRGQIAEALRQMADGLDPVGRRLAKSIEMTDDKDLIIDGVRFPFYLAREDLDVTVPLDGGVTVVRVPIATENFSAASTLPPVPAKPTVQTFDVPGFLAKLAD